MSGPGPPPPPPPPSRGDDEGPEPAASSGEAANSSRQPRNPPPPPPRPAREGGESSPYDSAGGAEERPALPRGQWSSGGDRVGRRWIPSSKHQGRGGYPGGNGRRHAAEPPKQVLPMYTGTVKRIDGDKGYGFVFCPELFTTHHADVWVSPKQINGFCVGESVQFHCQLDNKGRPQAMDLSHCEGSPEGASSSAQAAAAVLAASSGDAGADAELKAENEHRMTGTIKSYIPENGYGFITSPEAMLRYERDVFLHSRQIGDFVTGDTVTFAVRLTNGRPQAYLLKEASKSMAWLAGVEEDAENDKADENEVFLGLIKSFNSRRGYGFIGCPQLRDRFGRDVFIHQSQFEGLQLGDCVTFSVQVKKGQPQACDVLLAEGDQQALRQQLEGEAELVHQQQHEEDLRAEPDPVLARKLCRACSSVRADCIGAIEELLAAGAPPDELDVTGQRPLMLSALSNWLCERKCKLLIDHGADVQLPCGSSPNAIEWARERINDRFAAYLEGIYRGESVDYLVELAIEGQDEF